MPTLRDKLKVGSTVFAFCLLHAVSLFAEDTPAKPHFSDMVVLGKVQQVPKTFPGSRLDKSRTGKEGVLVAVRLAKTMKHEQIFAALKIDETALSRTAWSGMFKVTLYSCVLSRSFDIRFYYSFGDVFCFEIGKPLLGRSPRPSEEVKSINGKQPKDVPILRQ